MQTLTLDDMTGFQNPEPAISEERVTYVGYVLRLFDAHMGRLKLQPPNFDEEIYVAQAENALAKLDTRQKLAACHDLVVQGNKIQQTDPKTSKVFQDAAEFFLRHYIQQ